MLWDCYKFICQLCAYTPGTRSTTFYFHILAQAACYYHRSVSLSPDVKKGADARTLSAEVFVDCGNIKHDSLVLI